MLLTGPLPPGIGEFVASAPLGTVLEELRTRADVVLIDVPPLLQVGDVIALSPRIDASIIVARPSMLRKYGYGYGYGYGSRYDFGSVATAAGGPARTARGTEARDLTG